MKITLLELKAGPENSALMSAVKVQNAGVRPIERSVVHSDDRAWVEAELKDVGDQALMRGLVSAFPIVHPGLFLSYRGRRSVELPATKRLTGIPLPWSRPAHERRMCRLQRLDQVACASLAKAHMKPTSSRAIAVQTTVVFLPRALNIR
ncbi:hypothetical protein A9K71_21395 [Mesorhizobium sp. WSM3873]|nr:hypothetical protein A9K71_21395 [Mesorhizobium sp. WSM3873]